MNSIVAVIKQRLPPLTMSITCAHALTRPLPSNADLPSVIRRFMTEVNMSKAEIEDFLASEESRRAVEEGAAEGEEQDGRRMARRVIELLEKVGERKEDPHAYELSLLYEGDLEQMHQISEYVRCHTAAAPAPGASGVAESDADRALRRWHLMHCGHDPLKAVAKGEEGAEGVKQGGAGTAVMGMPSGAGQVED